jgi:hypothetical protein
MVIVMVLWLTGADALTSLPQSVPKLLAKAVCQNRLILRIAEHKTPGEEPFNLPLFGEENVELFLICS